MDYGASICKFTDIGSGRVRITGDPGARKMARADLKAQSAFGLDSITRGIDLSHVLSVMDCEWLGQRSMDFAVGLTKRINKDTGKEIASPVMWFQRGVWSMKRPLCG